LGRRSARQDERAFVIEGPKLLDEAVRAKAPIQAVYVAADADYAPPEADAPVHRLDAGVIERIADAVTPQPVLAVVEFVDVPLDALRTADFLVVCVDLRDPGNAGTVMRSAEAAGVDGLLFCGGSVDVYNPKTVRASAGSLFHVPVVVGGDAVAVLEQIADWGLARMGTAAHGGTDYTAADLTRPTALVLGNEANGLPAEAAAALDGTLTIPMVGRSESLNVGMAAAVLSFEVARQRRAEGRG
jgi:RNA methyltransferase, TrmH family